jgi:hypothetical protein
LERFSILIPVFVSDLTEENTLFGFDQVQLVIPRVIISIPSWYLREPIPRETIVR